MAFDVPETIAVIGGTGKLGAALSGRWAAAGLNLIIGSRAAADAQAVAVRLGGRTRGMTNADAAAAASIIVVTVPFAAQAAALADIAPSAAGKILIDTTVPLMPPKVMRVQLPVEGCAALRAQSLLPPDARIVAAFHNVAAHKLVEKGEIGCDVLVFGDDRAARERGVALAEAAGLRGLHGGALANAAAAEAMTSVLIFLNKTYQVDGAGIRITGSMTEPGAGQASPT